MASLVPVVAADGVVFVVGAAVVDVGDSLVLGPAESEVPVLVFKGVDPVVVVLPDDFILEEVVLS